MKDIVRQLYDNLRRFAAGRSANNAVFKEMFPPMNLLTDEKIASLEERLGITIHNAALFEQALTHRSYLQVTNTPDHRSNERLEFLGDAILGLVTAEYLFYNNKEVLEGELTKMRSWLVNKKSLAVCARKLRLDDALFISYSASQSLQKGSDGMLADALESIIAAVYLDRGFDEARTFIVDKLLPIMMEESLVQDSNFKSLLLEAAQARGLGTPRYVVAREAGPDHEKEFTIDVFVGEDCVGRGVGRNKKEAEQSAAEAGLTTFATKKTRSRRQRDSH
ncbi:MAG TPA: ribonuclease III [Chlorobiota bacterium]|nr:ribonuclease III [Chlorobiota bacterium]